MGPAQARLRNPPRSVVSGRASRVRFRSPARRDGEASRPLEPAGNRGPSCRPPGANMGLLGASLGSSNARALVPRVRRPGGPSGDTALGREVRMNLALKSHAILLGWSQESLASAISVTVTGLIVGGLLYLGLPVLYLPVLLAGGLLFLRTLRSPNLALSFVIASVFVPFALGGYTLLQLTGSMVAVLTLIWYGVNKRGVVFANSIFPICAFMILVLHSLGFTRNPEMAHYALRKLAFNAILCLLMVNLIDTREKMRRSLWILAAMGILNAVMAIYQNYTGLAVDSRSKGLQENENVLGEVSAVSFVIPFYLFLYGDRFWKRVTGLGLCAILSSGLVASVSRGAFFAFIGGLIFMLVREWRRWPRFLVFGVLL